MKNILRILFYFILVLNLSSCSKEEDDTGLQTVLKGHVSDNIRGTNISGYKIVLVKSWEACENFRCGSRHQEVATTYTDDNGDYSITFNYKLKEGESYSLFEQYYGTPYYPEYSQQFKISAGESNTFDINAWKPIELKLNVEVLNNIHGPLMIRNEIGNSNSAFLNTENIYEKDITKTYTLKSKPNSDIRIVFWYFTGNNPNLTLHEKTFQYHTTTADINTLNFTIDCSTF